MWVCKLFVQFGDLFTTLCSIIFSLIGEVNKILIVSGDCGSSIDRERGKQ